jgi:hypothetical protein
MAPTSHKIGKITAVMAQPVPDLVSVFLLAITAVIHDLLLFSGPSRLLPAHHPVRMMGRPE